jgi:putative endonuclease
MYFVYILRCSDNTFYTGITTNILRRVAEHNHPKSLTKYTRVRQPVVLMYLSDSFSSRSLASKEEYRIKKLSHKEKQILADSYSI